MNKRFIVGVSFWLGVFFLLGNIVHATTITSTDSVNISAIVQAVSTGGGGGGGSGGGSQQDITKTVVTTISFSGVAYPYATVSVQQIGGASATLVAGPDGVFTGSINGIPSESSLLVISATDTFGLQSPLIIKTVAIKEGYVTQIDGLAFAPTLQASKLDFLPTESLNFYGTGKGQSTVLLYIDTEASPLVSETLNDGTYHISTPSLYFSPGVYTIYSVMKDSLSRSRIITVSSIDKTVPEPGSVAGDCNADTKINIADFSILSYWFKRPNPPSCADIDGSGTVSIHDFSVLAFYWKL